MSLFRVCKQAALVSNRTNLKPLPALSRALTTDTAPSAEANTKETSDIAAPAQPPRDVMVADVISGAPGEIPCCKHAMGVLHFAPSPAPSPRCACVPADPEHYAKWRS